MPKVIPSILVVLACLVFAADSQADNSAGVVHYVDQGKKNYENGHYSQSIESFCRAFLLRPQDETTQLFLKKLSLTKGLKAREQIFLLNFEEALDYLQGLIHKRDYYQAQKDHLRSILLSSGVSQEEIDLRLTSETPINMEQIAGSQEETDPLKAVQIYLVQRKAGLNGELEKIISECDILARLHQEKNPVSLTERRQNAKQRIVSSEVVKAEEGGEADVPVKEDLASAFEQMKELKEFLTEDRKHIKEMADQIVSLTLSMAEKDATVLELGEKLNQKDKKITDLEAQLLLSQQILAEKNSDIDKLMGQVKSKDGSNAAAAEESGRIGEISGILEIYKAKLAETYQELSEKNTVLEKMRTQYDDLKVQVFSKDTALVKTKDQLASLKKEVDEMKSQMEELKMRLSGQQKGSLHLSSPLNQPLESQLLSISKFIQKYYQSDLDQ